MTIRAHRPFALSLALALTLAGSAVALASGPLKGKTYQGSAPAWGTSSEGHHRVSTHASGNITLAVAASGSAVTVRFTSPWPVLYCHVDEGLHVQSTKAASIAGNGKFKASVAQRFKAGPGPSPIVQVVTGRFSGHTVKGTIYTQAAECSGTASFSASVH